MFRERNQELTEEVRRLESARLHLLDDVAQMEKKTQHAQQVQVIKEKPCDHARATIHKHMHLPSFSEVAPMESKMRSRSRMPSAKAPTEATANDRSNASSTSKRESRDVFPKTVDVDQHLSNRTTDAAGKEVRQCEERYPEQISGAQTLREEVQGQRSHFSFTQLHRMRQLPSATLAHKLEENRTASQSPIQELHHEDGRDMLVPVVTLLPVELIDE